MADSNVSALTALALADVAAGDLFYIVDVSETGIAKAKKITVASLFGNGTNRTILTDGTSGALIVRQSGGVAGTDEAKLSYDGTGLLVAIADGAASRTLFNMNTLNSLSVEPTHLRVASYICFQADATSSVTTGGLIGREATGVISTKDFTAGGFTTWLQNTAGRSRVNADVTNATTTPAAITGLSFTTIAGRKYAGRLVLHCSTDQAAEGALFDFDGGAGTWTSFRAAVVANVQGATVGTTVSAAIATDLNFTALNGTGVNCIVIEFSGVANAAGTCIPRLAQNSHATGTLTVHANSSMHVEDMP